VDCYVTTNAYPFNNNSTNTTVVWSGNSTTYYSGASGSGSDKNGRANTAAISSKGTSAVQICKDLGAGWYLPAYEELVNMGIKTHPSLANGRSGAGILTLGDGQHWSSTEVYNNGGRYGYDYTSFQPYAIVVYNDGDLFYNIKSASNATYVRCAWRP
jgi:hypothetical protein